MLGLLRHGSHEHKDHKNVTKEPVVTEVVVTPESESPPAIARNAVFTPERRLSPRPSYASLGTPLGKKLNSRQSFLGRAVSYVGSTLGLSSHAYIQEQQTLIRRKYHHELGAEVSSRFIDTSFHALLTFIKEERLTRLPARGSAWDTVLLQAHQFADQIESLHHLVEELNTPNGAASQLVYGPCLLLLELGHENAATLAQIFETFHQLGLRLKPLLRNPGLFAASASIQDHLSRAYVDLINLVTSVAIQFHQAAHGLHGHGANSRVRIDLYASFGALIEVYYGRIKRAIHEMWTHSLRHAGMSEVCDIDVLQKWLGPQDSVLLFLASNNVTLGVRPVELTCTWFQSVLNSFIKGDQTTLLVEGKAGSGKTVLADWTVDRLQRPIGRKIVSTIDYTFNQNIAGQSTTLAMLHTLLYQLLELRVGDLGVYEAVVEAYRDTKNLHDADAIEDKLWHALYKALAGIDEQADETIVMIIDGVDEVQGRGKSVEAISKKLHELADRYSAVRLVQFCRPVEKAQHATRVLLDAERIGEDLRTVIAHRLRHVYHFYEQSSADEETIVDKLATAAGTSMLWAHLACSFLALQKTHKAFTDTLSALLSGPKTVSDVTVKLLEVLQLTDDAKKVLSFLAAAERPLQIGELRTLLQISIERQTVDNRHINIHETLQSLKSFVTKKDGLVSIIHADLETALIMIPNSSKVSLHLTERHRDMVMRLMIYAKSCLREEREAVLELVDNSIVESSFTSHHFLEYTVRYWITHFKRSTLYKASGKLQLPAEVVAVFAGSTLFAMLEQVCWSRQYALTDALEHFALSYRVRSEAVGTEKSSTLQTALSCAIFFHSAKRLTEAVEYYGWSSKISLAIFGAQADFTVHCCDLLLTISETMVVNKRTTIMTWRETTLLILVEARKHRHGANSKEVLEIYERLIALYVLIKEETKIIEYREIVRKITVIIEGGDRTVEGGEVERHLDLEIRKHRHAGQIDLMEGSLFGEVGVIVHEELTIILIETILRRAAKYCEHSEWAKAEELYVELWVRLTTHCQLHHVLEFHVKKIEVMLVFARFLESHKRHTEACAIVLSIWREYEHHEFSVIESVILLLNEVAIVMKSLSLLTVALAIFRKCWSYFRSSHREEHAMYKSIEENITIISKEIVQSSKTTIIHESSESVIREVFESSVSETIEITTTTIELAKSLTAIYIKQERYSEAVQCYRTILKKSWSSFFSASLESIILSSHLTQENIEIVLKMAHCHIMEKRLEKAENCYIRLYRAVRASRQINDVLVVKYSELLVEFYQKYEYWNKAIAFYQELLVAYRAFYGASHKLVIQILYKLGDLCRLHNRTHGYWIEYYVEIVTVLNKGLEVCHEDAVRALIIVANYYYEDQRFSESLTYFKLILATFVKFGKKYKFFESTIEVQLIFEHYFRSLEESRTDISIQIEIIKRYREACMLHFSATAEISIHATLLLAETYTRHESYQFEAIELYEHVRSITKSTEIITKIKKTLTTLYVKKVTSSTTVTKETIERSTKIVHERYIEVKKSHSCYHAETLTYFRDLVLLYHKCSHQEVAIKEIRSLIAEWLVTITSAAVFMEVARFVAELYRHCEYTIFAHELIREFKMQIIYKRIEHGKSWGIDITKLGHAALTFVAALEWSLSLDVTMTFTHYISALMAEALYYQRFCSVLHGKSVIEVIVCSARLYKTLIHTKRFQCFADVEHRTLDFFIKHESSMSKVSRSGAHALVMILIQHYTSLSSEAAFVAFAGHTALQQIKKLIHDNKHKEAYELTEATYAFLMAHEGLDDPTEIGLGFQLCLLMAGRGPAAAHKPQEGETKKKMLDLSRKILGEVFDICAASKINLTRLQLTELNELITLVGEQKDYKRLQWLLSMLWNTREGQKTWSPETRLNLGLRLVQVEFLVADKDFAVKLCRDLWYNCRRVHGARHANTLRFAFLLRQLYTSTALSFQHANKPAKAKIYFQKAMTLDHEMLKLLADDTDAQDSDEDDDLATELGASVNGTTNGHAEFEADRVVDHETLLEYLRRHLRGLRLVHQRHGGWHRQSHEYERLTGKIWKEYGAELKLKEEHVHAAKWDASAFGQGKSEGEEDIFKAPAQWTITV